MSGRSKLAAVALGAVVAVTAGSAQAVSFNYAKIEFADFGPGPVDGLVVVAQRRRSEPRAHVWASFHGLPLTKEGSGTLILLGSRQPCADAIVFDTSVYRLRFAASKADVFHSASVRLRAPLRKAKTVRLFKAVDGQPGKQYACGRVS
jgi:hypothetical protein